jgi:hypothetical protein
VSERRALRPGLWLIAVAAVGMLLVEVWQNARLAEQCLILEQTRTELARAQARLEYVRARLDRAATRAELVPLASQLGLAPADAQQVVQLPTAYLADGEDARPVGRSSTALAWAERAARALVPEATARGRDRN